MAMTSAGLTDVQVTNDQLVAIITERLPRLLEMQPAVKRSLYHPLVKFLAEEGLFDRFDRKVEELYAEMRDGFEQVDQHFEQVDQRFEQVDQRFEQVDQRFEQVDQRFERLEKKVDTGFEQVDHRFEKLETKVDTGFEDLTRQIDRLGSRWGIRNESLFRETMTALLEESFGVKVERRIVGGEEFDVVISDGKHILVEIAASVKRGIEERLERKRQLYIKETGVAPDRFILTVASIHSRRAQALRQAGFEVIEPED